MDPDVFFPGPNESCKIALAKSICRGCDVAAECLEYCEQMRMGLGIWGGLSDKDRRRRRAAMRQAECTAPVRRRTPAEWTLQPCGTDAAYERHRARGEDVDAKCRRAHNAAVNERRRAH